MSQNPLKQKLIENSRKIFQVQLDVKKFNKSHEINKNVRQAAFHFQFKGRGRKESLTSIIKCMKNCRFYLSNEIMHISKCPVIFFLYF